MNTTLAINGGQATINYSIFDTDNFKWPIYTEEDEQALLEVMHGRKMSGTDITKKFEQEYAEWLGCHYALGYCNGTAAVHAALWACGVGAGDEIICPSITYWASCTAALSLGATVNFADIDPVTLCLDPKDIEHRIGLRTKAIVVVHYSGYPADMDEIMAIAGRHGVKVIEDTSHSHGTTYKGRMTGTIGDIAAQSMMTAKAFAIGEAGIITTNNRELFERCISYGHYERTGVASNANPADCYLTDPDLLKFAGIPLGGRKDRMNQWCSAIGRVQLKYYPERIKEVDKAMNHFSDLLDEIPGLTSHRPREQEGYNKGGWYHSLCHYAPEQLHGVSIKKFANALKAEGIPTTTGANYPLHIHRVFHEADIFHMGKPTAISFGQRDVRQGPGTLPISEALSERIFSLPHFVRFNAKMIEEFAEVYRKVVENIDHL